MSVRSKHLVLVVDDDVDLLATVKDFLEFEGYDVATAPDGEPGLARMGELDPDLIILDMNMPGMGGIPFLKEMAKKPAFADIPVFVFTARANLEGFFTDTKVAGFMAKPCDPDDLLMQVRKILAGRPFRGSGGEGGAQADEEAQAGIKVLLAEDEVGRRVAIASHFERLGWRVVQVDSGIKVVPVATAEKPDVIVMRVVLKDMNGDAVSADLGKVEATRDIPIMLYEDSGAIPRDRSDGGKPRRIMFVNTARHDRLAAAVQEFIGS